MEKNAKILVIGHDDVIERSLVDYLKKSGFGNVRTAGALHLDLQQRTQADEFFSREKIDYVFLGSVRSGGIEANQKLAADFLLENLCAQNNVIRAAHQNNVKKLLYLASSCIYPKDSAQPLREDSLLTGPLEETSAPYAVAKIAGVKTCQAFRKQYGMNAVVAVPATVYGPGCETDLATAHVLGALLAKFHRAVEERSPEVSVWGSGAPRREFIFADDFAEAAALLMDNYDGEAQVNIGCGEDVSIRELAALLAGVTGFKGKIVFDASKPDGVKQKLLDNTALTKMGWKPKIRLQEGLERTYQWYKQSALQER